MIGTNDGRQFETEFDYLVDVGGWGKTANRMPVEAPAEPAGAFSEEGRYPSSGALSSYTLSDADDPIKAWDQLAMMKKETFVGGRRVGEGGGGLSKPANDNSAIDGYFDRIKRSQTYKNLVKERGEPGEFSYQGAMKSLEGLKADIKKGLEGKDFRNQDSRTSHTIPEGLSPDQVNKLKELRGDILGPTPKPDLKSVETPREIKGYRIWDNVEKRYVSDMYQPRRDQSRRANNRAEKMNLDYGAHRYSKQIIWEDE